MHLLFSFTSILVCFATASASGRSGCDCESLTSSQMTVAYIIRELLYSLNVLQPGCSTIEDIVEANKVISFHVRELDQVAPCETSFTRVKSVSSQCDELNGLMSDFEGFVQTYRDGLKKMCACRCQLNSLIFKTQLEKLKKF